MSVLSTLLQATLAASLALATLAGCQRQEPPPPVQAPAQPTQVTPSSDLRGASDHPEAPPAVGALTAGQASGGARGGAVQPTAGDRASGPASTASEASR